ncbi:helix-turn-helix domain-containing protein [Streptomyces sp. NPDC019937]|uniref:helix-turn-helix domain-containing protein n=1 Tax=Streptomyces sp. NPDC019937 TaxID=3154787 RepID=UPI00340141A5
MTAGLDMTIGERIELLRRRRGLSRQTLASLVGYSSEWLRQVERKGRQVDRLSTLLRLAQVLHVKDVAAFMGVAVPQDRVEQLIQEGEPDIRAALLGQRTADVAGVAVPPGDLTRLCRDVNDAWTSWHHSAHRYSLVRARLPGLLARVYGCHAWHSARQALPLSAQVHRLTSAFLHSTGELPHALLAADRALAEARQAGEALLAAACLRGFGDVLLRLHSAGQARELCVAEADGLALDGEIAAEEVGAERTWLYLTAAEAAAFQQDHHEAERLMDMAEELAGGLRGSDIRTATPVTPVDVAAHRVRVEAVLGRTARALRLAEQVEEVDALHREGRVRFYLTLARAHLQARDQSGAVLALMQADRDCGEEMRCNVYARHLLRQAISQDSVTVRRDLHQLAESAGIV